MSMSREVPLVHPGTILLEDWLKPLGISQYALARAIGVPRRRINEIIQGRRAISADTALRLAAFFGVDAESWLALQAHYDAVQRREALAQELAKIPRYEQLANERAELVREF
ncbi:MAG: HigA family addiction module antitoxin [Tepidiphilus sp.]|jgi:addiction module HigA family antidote|nr:HigA family addiction module antitoxin [Tepidiphilus sp.]MDD3432943.1 HigA family addiction module antitoxin [Tepidiphilus sp.]